MKTWFRARSNFPSFAARRVAPFPISHFNHSKNPTSHIHKILNFWNRIHFATINPSILIPDFIQFGRYLEFLANMEILDLLEPTQIPTKIIPPHSQWKSKTFHTFPNILRPLLTLKNFWCIQFCQNIPKFYNPLHRCPTTNPITPTYSSRSPILFWYQIQ